MRKSINERQLISNDMHGFRISGEIITIVRALNGERANELSKVIDSKPTVISEAENKVRSLTHEQTSRFMEHYGIDRAMLYKIAEQIKDMRLQIKLLKTDA